MTAATILPVPTEKGGILYRGVAGDKYSEGSTVGEALDALKAQLPEDEPSVVVVVQSLRPDQFFDAAQQRRLAELMGDKSAALHQGKPLGPQEQTELDALIEAELSASANRAAILAEKIGR